MGLSERERAGCRALLELMATDELMTLTDTITNRLVLPQSRQEAIHAILVYSQSVEELLKRRKVCREIIFKYLAKEGVVVPPCSEKHQLIHHAKQYWSGQLTDHVAETEYINPNKQIFPLLLATYDNLVSAFIPIILSCICRTDCSLAGLLQGDNPSG
uniref:Uncharacterized protein n=1 Tax=Gopherus agassizii TaxID=38772 RepID=A0A452HSU1_9SAUR